MSPLRVVLADDDRLVRSGLRVLLDAEAHLEVAGEAADGHQAIALARSLRPDVVVMDVRMPGCDGLVATREIVAMPGAGPRVLVLTTFDLDDVVYEAIRSGASGFLLKRSPPEELVAAIEVVAAGDALITPSVTRRLLEAFTRHQPPDRRTAGALAGLTPRELDVLRLVARGLSNAEIARHLHIGHETVKSHVKHVLTKIDARDRAQAVVFAYESALVRPGEA